MVHGFPTDVEAQWKHVTHDICVGYKAEPKQWHSLMSCPLQEGGEKDNLVSGSVFVQSKKHPMYMLTTKIIIQTTGCCRFYDVKPLPFTSKLKWNRRNKEYAELLNEEYVELVKQKHLVLSDVYTILG